MTKKLSIIIPVYNGENHIVQCFLSILNQITSDVEIIVINDGSTDGTNELVEKFLSTLNNNASIKYISTLNGGVSQARNIGLDNASGAYVAFVDADDAVTPNYIAEIISAIETDVSIIEFGFRMIDLQGRLIRDNYFLHKRFGMHSASSLMDTVFSACIWYPVLRVFRRELFDELRFPVGVRFCEDLMTLSQAYRRATSIYSLNRVLYEYKINPAGATLNIRPDYASNLVDFYREIMKDQSFPNKALKINLAYAIRRCTANGDEYFGKMPVDIENDVAKLAFTLKLFWKIRFRIMIRAIFSPFINRIFSIK